MPGWVDILSVPALVWVDINSYHQPFLPPIWTTSAKIQNVTWKSNENLSKSDGCSLSIAQWNFVECLDVNCRGAFHENPKSDTRKVWQDNPHPTCRGPQIQSPEEVGRIHTIGSGISCNQREKYQSIYLKPDWKPVKIYGGHHTLQISIVIIVSLPCWPAESMAYWDQSSDLPYCGPPGQDESKSDGV